MQNDYAQDFDLIRHAALEAGKLALSYWGRSIEKQRKADGSEVTEADHAVDALLAELLKGARPGYGWLSEESPEHNERFGPVASGSSILSTAPERSSRGATIG